MSPSAGSRRRGDTIAKLLLPGFLFLAAFAVYAATAAPGTLFGDPSEYQFISAILGIAHPPGYAFYIMLAKLWQLLVPVGTVAFRTNLLSAAVGAWTVTAVYLLVRELQLAIREGREGSGNRTASGWTASVGLSPLSAVFAALSLAAAPDFWQHAIHANPHIVSAALTVTHLLLLSRWSRTGRKVWLGAFGASMGLAVTHHPITLMGVPAYGLFMLTVRGKRLFRWDSLLLIASCLLVGLSPFLYYPLRSPSAPFGPTDMNTWDGFIRHVTARGLRVNLFHFGLPDQPDRAVVFWSLLKLQFPLPIIFLMPIGLTVLTRRSPRTALLLGAFLAGHLAFTLNTVQDVMAYLLAPFAGLAVLGGIGAQSLVSWSIRRVQRLIRVERARPPKPTWTRLSVATILLVWPLVRGVENLSRGISLRDFEAAELWVDEVHSRFSGKEGGAVLLSAWEQLTPLWVHGYTEGRRLHEEDVDLEYVSTATPWSEAVWSYMDIGPVYLPDFRPPVKQAGFRLVPDGTLYRVERPPLMDATPSHQLDVLADGRIRILGYDLPQQHVHMGEPLELVLYQTIDEDMDAIWMPYAALGEVEARWTTDSRLLTSSWEPGEVVVERYELPVPFQTEPGTYPLRVGYADLTGGRPAVPLSTGRLMEELSKVTVLPPRDPSVAEVAEVALANLDNQIGLMTARVRFGLRSRQAFWEEPLVAKAGRSLHLRLDWRALASPRGSATVFIHLIDGADRPVAGWDYTPLGGSAPTYLWFPKWLPGQAYTDPYRLPLAPDLPPGDYRLEVGMYDMTSQRRLPVVDWSGDLAGDRVVLGPIRIE